MTLVRVIRGGLELGECLSGLTAGPTKISETHPRTVASRISEQSSEHPTRADPNRLCRLHRYFGWIPELSFLPEMQRNRRNFSRQGDLRQFRPDAVRDATLVDVLKRSGFECRCVGCSFEHALEKAIVV